MAVKVKLNAVQYKDENGMYQVIPAFAKDESSAIEYIGQAQASIAAAQAETQEAARQTKKEITTATAELVSAASTAANIRDDLEKGLDLAIGYSYKKQYLQADKRTTLRKWIKNEDSDIVEMVSSSNSTCFQRTEILKAGTYRYENITIADTYIEYIDGSGTIQSLKNLASNGTVVIPQDYILYATCPSGVIGVWVSGTELPPSGADGVFEASSSMVDELNQNYEDLVEGLDYTFGYEQHKQYLLTKNKTLNTIWSGMDQPNLSQVVETTYGRASFAKVSNLKSGTYTYQSLLSGSSVIEAVSDNSRVHLSSFLAATAGTVTIPYDFNLYASTNNTSVYPYWTDGTNLPPIGTEGVWTVSHTALDQKRLTLKDANWILRKITGTGGNTTIDDANGTRIRIVYHLPPFSTFKIFTPLEPGVAVSLYKLESNSISAGSSGRIETYTNATYKMGPVIGRTSQGGWLSISLSKTDGTSSITDEEKANLLSNLIVDIRYKKIKIDQSKLTALSNYYYFVSGSATSQTIKKKNLTFGVITDLHGSSDAFERFRDICNDNNKYLNFAICLGDSAPYIPFDSDDNWINSIADNFNIPFYYVIGNHDVANSGSNGTSITEAMARTRYYNTIEKNTHQWLTSNNFAGEGKCSWYKDIDNIRIISLFNYNTADERASDVPSNNCRCWYTQEELEWFINLLKDATTNNKSVIVMLHQPPFSFYRQTTDKNSGAIITNRVVFEDHPFSTTEKLSYLYKHPDEMRLDLYYGEDYPIVDIIHHFMYGQEETNSITYNYPTQDPEYSVTLSAETRDFSTVGPGTFICYFCGHVHSSYILRSYIHEDQICIAVPSGSSNLYQRNKFGDILYDENANQDNFYFIGIDTDLQQVNLMQIGGHTTTDLRTRDIASISYSNIEPA